MAGGGQRLLRLLTNVLEACKRTSIPVKSGRIQTRHSREGEIAARQLVSFAAVSHTAQRQPLTRFEDITQKSTKTIPLRLERAVTQYGDFQFA